MRASIIAIVAAGCLATPASAATFLFKMTGSFRASDSLSQAGSSANLLPASPAFQFKAKFDDSSPNLVGFFPFPGFAAFAPTSATLRVGGTTYDVQSYSAGTPNGIAVSLFDPRQPFFSGFYGAGFIANPAVDGAGIVLDFSGANPGLLVDAIAPTTFTGFRGVGYNNGPGCAPVVTPQCAPTPIALTSGGQNYLLSFAASESIDGLPGFSASIEAVPEPATWAMMMAGFAAVGAGVRRRRKVCVGYA